LSRRLDELRKSRTVWFSGHSLGAALATLAAARFPDTKGVVTLGSPRVGDGTFVAAFDRRFSGRSLRYVNDTDIVTHVPPPILIPFLYDHVDSLRQIASDGDVSTRRPRLDHYFVELINDTGHVREVVEGLRKGVLTRPPKFLLDHMPRGYAVDIWNDYARRGSLTDGIAG
jgi:pimeloyl-ACP methyl ester carboxylesterase